MSGNKEKVCVLGLGYVGLTLALTLADAGLEVIGVDISEEIVGLLRQGKSLFFEKGLERLLAKHIGSNLKVYCRIPPHPCRYYIICVGTPVDQKTKIPSFRHLRQTVLSIAPHLKKGDTVILRSTVPVGVSRKVVLRLLEEHAGLKSGKDFYFVFAPERTIEGRALYENRNIPQIIGPVNLKSFDRASRLFTRFNKKVLMLPDMEHAEMLKVIDNTFRDVFFAYSNQIALICEKLSLNMHTILEAANKDYKRNLIAHPSPGVGGSCLTKDPYLLIDLCKRLGVTPQLIETARRINEIMPVYLRDKLVSKMRRAGKKISGSKVFILGFAFKGHPETSDTRFSTTSDFLKNARPLGCEMYGYDPIVDPKDIESLGVRPCSIEEGFRNADAIIFMNNHRAFKNIDLSRLVKRANKPCIIFDCWDFFSKTSIVKDKGVVYGGIGIY
jgi:UDP-N-acetyl-D-mannosaminuronic acid dehydrogenase